MLRRGTDIAQYRERNGRTVDARRPRLPRERLWVPIFGELQVCAGKHNHSYLPIF